MKKELKVWAMTCIVLWSLAPGEINAQQTDSTGSRYLDEVLITSSKFPKTRAQTGKVLDIITREDILRSGTSDLSQLLQGRSGIFVNGSNSNPGKDKGIYLRGASPQHTLLMINGIPVNDPSGVNGVFDLRMLSLANVERIEILKGAQSTLYGSDAMAGVINIITREGEGRVQPSVQTSYGSFDQWNVQANVSGSSEKISFSAGYTYRSSAGISEAAPLSDTAEFDKDPFSQHALDLRASVKLGRNISLSPFLQYSDTDGRYDNGAFSDADENSYLLENLRYGAALRGGERNSWQVQFAHQRSDRQFSSVFGDFEGNGDYLHAEAFYLHRFSPVWQAMAGFAFQEQSLRNTGIENASLAAPYATVFYSPGQAVNVEAGVRFNFHSAFGEHLTVNINPSWLIAPSVKAFANFTTGFKAPTPDQLFGQFGPNPELRPERSRSMEAGAAWFTERADVRFTFFNRRIEDIIIYTDRYVNSDVQEVQGIEIEPRFTVGERLELLAGYTWLNGTLELQEADSSFSGLLRQPEHSFNFGLNYMFTEKLSGRVVFQYFGKRNDAFFDPADFTSKVVEMEAYTLTDISLAYRMGPVRIFGEVRNLFNTDYFESFGYSVLGRNIHFGLGWNMSVP